MPIAKLVWFVPVSPADDVDTSPAAAEDDFGFDDASPEEAAGAGGADEEEDPFAAEPEQVPAVEEEEDDLFGAPTEDDDTAAAGGGAIAAAPEEPQESAQLIFARKFRAIVQDRDSKEQELRQERVERAEGEMEQWRSMRTEHREKTTGANRDAERELVEAQAAEKESTNSWAQVVKSIDTQASSEEGRTDAARMRSVLIQLKNNPLKPPISAAPAPVQTE